MHSGISYLCLLCGQIYARRTIPHACNAKEKDFIYIHGESGIQGDAARKILDKFINERQDKNWKYVASEKCPSEASTPQHKVKSSVKKIEKGRIPIQNDRRKGDHQKVYSPIPLGDDPQIEVGEAPLFDPPVPVLETDPDYVNSLEELAARILPKENRVETAQTATERDETTECTKILENILDNMTQLQTPQNHLQTQHTPLDTEQNTQQTKTTDENNNIEHEKSKENTEETNLGPAEQEHQQAGDEEKRLRREKRKQRKAERKRFRDLETQLNEEENINKKNKTEKEPIIITETENNSTDPDPENITFQPIVTVPDRLAEEREKLETDLKSKQSGRITLDVGGRHFATSKETLMKDKNSLFTILLEDQKNHYFIDRDGAHFRYVLNYLREDCTMDIAILPRETRYLKELRNECIYYKLMGLLEIVNARLDQYNSLGLAF